MALKLFLDTYAILAIIDGNKEYASLQTEECCTSLINLYELYVSLLRSDGEETARSLFLRYKMLMVPIEDEDIMNASAFKIQHNKRDLSYADALGYIMAKRRNLYFVTGDKQFKDIGGVRFIK